METPFLTQVEDRWNALRRMPSCVHARSEASGKGASHLVIRVETGEAKATITATEGLRTLDITARLHTPRLVLLPAHEGLAGRVAAFYQRNAAHLAPWDPPAPEGFATEAFQAGRLCKAVTEAAAGTALRWWIEPREEPSQLVGSIGLSQIARGAFQNAMLGYAIDSAYEGKGLMREALEAVIGHAFSAAVCLHRIQANVRPENLRSVALLARLGFDEEGLAREYLFIDGAWRDHRMFALRNTAYPGAPQY